MYQAFLAGEGYPHEIDNDGDVLFKCEGRSYFILISENDHEYFKLVFPGFWSIDNDAERERVERAALLATADTKVAKVYPVGDNVWATIELFCMPPENFKAVFRRSMSALRHSVDTFVEEMRK
jgi:hypothetical protein